MKRLVLILTLVFSFLLVRAADITPISNAFKAGNASSLATLMAAEVDMAVPGASKKCNGNDAVAMLNSFFGTNKPAGFSVLHNADKKDSGFLVGKLPTSKGEFRVNITYKSDGNKAVIQSIRIE
ncbi:hypothetical protein M2459_000601 [Parabacteroides sp. PF5-5]|uniref:DUF4783 domain-containing protein n=1 Tax=unclassified Parabacteroides TaxID=2649774 RepID=UPI002474C7D0|nr:MULTISPECIES: DUF4783 domain-containing protein [unclassified Parabacteroides]MDH6303466.1 hypothetical protein [Parabacteroides sp. PH5-39]MDH6314788.1 hypothetical protein [Parabacteroides sp. PF5-13]MDH6318125.1 hypothetical protein [Parabacteroides sp. PH5-13]MDH6321943.1 hypothetical protein [Parabacteroides sp. PH5-8]MDH6326067.1 hypothetical protein [Parabacteroides sp. PH5-41]